MPCFGVHTSIAGGLHNALTEGRGLGCDCIQLFVANQRQWKHPELTAEQITQFQQTRQETALAPLTAHSSYLINLGATNPETHQKSMAALGDELNRCEQLGIEYLVLHPGSHMGEGEEAGLTKIAESLQQVIDRIAPRQSLILLETTAGQGTNLGYRFEQLAWIIEQSGRADHFGVCLDTCHIFSAGYDYRSADKCQAVIDQFDRTIGLERLKVIHVNDSKNPLGKKVDRHAHIGQGEIGSQPIGHIVRHPRLRDLPFILETPKDTTPDGQDYDRVNLALLRQMARSNS